MDSFDDLIGRNVNEIELDESSDFLFVKLEYLYKNCGRRYAASKLKLAELDYFNLISFSNLFKRETLFIIWYNSDDIVTDLEVYYLSNDFDVLFSDYYIILSAIRDGRAHQLREGDTKYLGASRLKDMVAQPNSDKLANKRELVLKKRYLDKILNEIA